MRSFFHSARTGISCKARAWQRRAECLFFHRIPFLVDRNELQTFFVREEASPHDQSLDPFAPPGEKRKNAISDKLTRNT